MSTPPISPGVAANQDAEYKRAILVTVGAICAVGPNPTGKEWYQIARDEGIVLEQPGLMDDVRAQVYAIRARLAAAHASDDVKNALMTVEKMMPDPPGP